MDGQDSSELNQSTMIKDQIIEKLNEQNTLLKERLMREESHSHVLEQELHREKRRVSKKQKANRSLKEQVRMLQM